MDNTRMENAAQELANIQSQCQELIDRIREIEKEIKQDEEQTFERVKEDELYYMVSFMQGAAVTDNNCDDYCEIDDERFNNNNYFKTPERATEVADKVNFLLQLERFYDTFCPDYVPDWNSDATKFAIYYNHERTKPRYEVQPYCSMRYPTNVYFPSEEIAQKVCDILNKERENNEE
jgi:hypothetical protein